MQKQIYKYLGSPFSLNRFPFLSFQRFYQELIRYCEKFGWIKQKKVARAKSRHHDDFFTLKNQLVLGSFISYGKEANEQG